MYIYIQFSVHKYTILSQCLSIISLVPRSFEEEEKESGTQCLRMLHYLKNLGGLDTRVNYSASLIRIPVCDIIVHLPFELLCVRVSYIPTDVRILTLLHLSVFLSMCTL